MVHETKLTTMHGSVEKTMYHALLKCECARAIPIAKNRTVVQYNTSSTTHITLYRFPSLSPTTLEYCFSLPNPIPRERRRKSAAYSPRFRDSRIESTCRRTSPRPWRTNAKRFDPRYGDGASEWLTNVQPERNSVVQRAVSVSTAERR